MAVEGVRKTKFFVQDFDLVIRVSNGSVPHWKFCWLGTGKLRLLGEKKHCSGKLKSMTLTRGLSHICFVGADVFAGKKVNLLAKPLKPPPFLYIC